MVMQNNHKKKYAIYPGMVISKEDGQEHYVTFADLVKLYFIPMFECVHGGQSYYEDELIKLYPLYKGNYQEVLREKKQKTVYERVSCSGCSSGDS